MSSFCRLLAKNCYGRYGFPSLYSISISTIGGGVIEPEFASEDFLLRSLGGGGKSFSVPSRTCSVTCDVFARNFLCFFCGPGLPRRKAMFVAPKKYLAPPYVEDPTPPEDMQTEKPEDMRTKKFGGLGFPFLPLYKMRTSRRCS